MDKAQILFISGTKHEIIASGMAMYEARQCASFLSAMTHLKDCYFVQIKDIIEPAGDFIGLVHYMNTAVKTELKNLLQSHK